MPDGESNFAYFNLGPETYFVTNDDNSTCYLAITNPDNNLTECWFGEPFFRNFDVVLDYSQDSVSLYKKDVSSPLFPDDIPIEHGYM